MAIDLVDGATRVDLKRVGKDSEGKPLDLPPATVFVRKEKRSDQVRIMRAVGVAEGSASDQVAYASLRVRWSIVGAENFTDANSLKTVLFTQIIHPTLGQIASEAVFDALNDADFALVFAASDPASKATEPLKGN